MNTIASSAGPDDQVGLAPHVSDDNRPLTSVVVAIPFFADQLPVGRDHDVVGLAVLILLAFLRNFKVTLIAAVTVPMVLSITVLLLYTLGMSFADAIGKVNGVVDVKDGIVYAGNALVVHVDRVKAALTLIAANLTEQYHPRIPTNVTRLDYYGRELEIGIKTHDHAASQNTTHQIDSTWTRLRPVVESNGGHTQAKTFDAAVARVNSARTLDQYQRAAAVLLDDVDRLESVFSH